MKDDSVYLKDIIDNARLAIGFAENLDFPSFERDIRTSYACARCIEIIGEAAKNLGNTAKAKFPGIPWKDVAGMRDILIHNYSGVNARKVWDTIRNDLPELLQVLEK
jgi:uncharacterized protein with HEPN domain